MKIESKILIALHRVTNIIDKRTIKLVNDHGLSLSQFMVLEALYTKGEMSIGEVSDKILSTAGTIPMIVNNLEKADLIKRRTDENDRRRSILSLTVEGKEIILIVAPKNIEIITQSMECLDSSEKQELLMLLKKLGGYNDGKKNKS